jgi:hypothetical protein
MIASAKPARDEVVAKFHRRIMRLFQNMNNPNDAQSSETTKLGGNFTFAGTSMTVHRVGYGAMQLAGPGVWGPPRDPDAAVTVLRESVAAGVKHVTPAISTGRT